MRLLLEGDQEFRAPTKGDNVSLVQRQHKQHAIVFCTSNLPDVEEFKKSMRETGVRSTWTVADYNRILGTEGGRIGGSFRSETAVPPILRKELYQCPRCGARLLRWLVKTFILSTTPQRLVTKENIWTDSDTEEDNDFTGFDENTSFWEIMKMNPDRLHALRQEEQLNQASYGAQTVRLEGDDIQAFLEFKEKKEEERIKRMSLSSSSSSTFDLAGGMPAVEQSETSAGLKTSPSKKPEERIESKVSTAPPDMPVFKNSK